jgi:hypothetical protein
MAISHLSIVNQKLVHAGTLLAMASASGAPSSTAERLKSRALIDSAVLHLGLAYIFYLRELGENYRIKGLAQINNAAQLAAALESANKSPSEARELMSLEQDQHTWLHQMLAAHALLQRSPEPEKPQKAFPSGQFIQLVEVTDTPEGPVPLESARVSGWLAEFRTLIIRQRDTSAEF